MADIVVWNNFNTQTNIFAILIMSINKDQKTLEIPNNTATIQNEIVMR